MKKFKEKEELKSSSFVELLPIQMEELITKEELANTKGGFKFPPINIINCGNCQNCGICD